MVTLETTCSAAAAVIIPAAARAAVNSPVHNHLLLLIIVPLSIFPSFRSIHLLSVFHYKLWKSYGQLTIFLPKKQKIVTIFKQQAASKLPLFLSYNRNEYIRMPNTEMIGGGENEISAPCMITFFSARFSFIPAKLWTMALLRRQKTPPERYLFPSIYNAQRFICDNQ